jgi:hypothetical protein
LGEKLFLSAIQLFFSQSQIPAKVRYFDLPTKAGRSRYFSKPVEIETPEEVRMKDRKSGRVFAEENRSLGHVQLLT